MSERDHFLPGNLLISPHKDSTGLMDPQDFIQGEYTYGRTFLKDYDNEMYGESEYTLRDEYYEQDARAGSGHRSGSWEAKTSYTYDPEFYDSGYTIRDNRISEHSSVGKMCFMQLFLDFKKTFYFRSRVFA